MENEIKVIEQKIENLVSLKREKEIENSKQVKKKWIFFKKSNNLEKEILEIEENIKKLQYEIISLKSKDPKFSADLRANIKNELKAYIIQKILNRPESTVIFNGVNTIINEIMKEISSDRKITNSSEIKDTIKNEMIDKLKENFEFSQEKNINTLEAFKK
ncbi:hypothetical protein RN96_04835 [Fusobacterium polymorphum]|uniref:Uncharacterized protein n=1 Tax=Fusobacterium nucleatum subsp. polymorphum TaxID=76857 RepID=A0A2B7YPT7_FUSNP|nr:hypothetical protein RN96_04835 [Fusobacterium polymorphum]